MTALAAVPATDRRQVRLAPRGLTWAVLRLHRTALYLWAAGLMAVTAGLVWAYILREAALADMGACGLPGSSLSDCSTIQTITADDTYREIMEMIAPGITFVMVPVAAWAGGALIGRELESGTARLAWTQSVTPMRWLAAKLAVPALLLTAGITWAVLLNNWALANGNRIPTNDWYHPTTYASTGPVAVAYVLAGLALGALAGLVTRKALPAAGVAFAATLVFYIVLTQYRPSLWPADTVTGPTALNLPPDAAALEHGAVTTTGEHVGNNFACVGSDSAADVRNCMERSGLTDFWATYHPRSHFWPLHLVETGIVLAVAALATATAFWLLRRRTA
ncbi:ABC transporter permease subunit [Streptomyces yerevanensis]|uniref:ABC transporter permease subunit n=1 Tax=Streptomyces yerevanensis TaxID=66378 RepID=UPI0005257F79|nr:ABC transporter permease subunit [Streptomyces yerevanensis]